MQRDHLRVLVAQRMTQAIGQPPCCRSGYAVARENGPVHPARNRKHVQNGAAAVAGQIARERPRQDSPNAGSLARQAARYLSNAHRDNIEAGCPLSGFAGDAPRVTDAARACYAQGLEAYVDRLAAMIAAKSATPEQTRREAIAAFSQMVGALVLSRAIAGANPAFADEILDASRRAFGVETPAPLDER